MRFASLGSGSRGNGTLVRQGETCLLIDLGFGIRDTESRLADLSLKGSDIEALIVTHEHSDHIQGVAGFARKYNIPVYLSAGTAGHRTLEGLKELHLINSHKSFRLGQIEITPVAVPHDAREPCQYVFSSGDQRLGLLTDLGHVTPFVIDNYKDCDALILEANHDPDMLANGSYPWPLKRRVGGDHGHLSNDQAAELVDQMDLDRLQHLVLSHLSEQNNRPELALGKIESVLRGGTTKVLLSRQKQVLDWIDLP